LDHPHKKTSMLTGIVYISDIGQYVDLVWLHANIQYMYVGDTRVLVVCHPENLTRCSVCPISFMVWALSEIIRKLSWGYYLIHNITRPIFGSKVNKIISISKETSQRTMNQSHNQNFNIFGLTIFIADYYLSWSTVLEYACINTFWLLKRYFPHTINICNICQLLF
jgi:hypothetical protein